MDAAKAALCEESVRKFDAALAEKNNLAYAIIQTLNFVVQQNNESTIQALNEELHMCSEFLLNTIRGSPTIGDRTLLS